MIAFRGRDTEAQRGEATCPKSHSQQGQSLCHTQAHLTQTLSPVHLTALLCPFSFLESSLEGVKGVHLRLPSEGHGLVGGQWSLGKHRLSGGAGAGGEWRRSVRTGMSWGSELHCVHSSTRAFIHLLTLALFWVTVETCNTAWKGH